MPRTDKLTPTPISALDFMRAALRDAPNSDEIALVTSMIKVRAILAAGTDVDSSFVPVFEREGYLKRSIDEIEVYVPFNLVSVFPGQERLGDLVGTARSMVLSGGHPICLSGSATFLGRSIPISDLDFCEYFPSPIASMPSLITGRIGSSLEQLLVRVNWNGNRFSAPFDGLQVELDRLANEAVTYVKLDFLWDVPKFGMMPTTSMILKVNDNFCGEALRRSHVHQEAVICRGEPPRDVFGISEICGYLTFLRSEVSKYAASGQESGSTDSLKALKRALSLLLLVGAEQDPELHAEVEGLIEDLTSPAVEGIVVERRFLELSELAADVDPKLRRKANDELARTKLGVQDVILRDEERELVLRGASEAAAALEAIIEQLFSTAKRSGH
ncbi:hypothetical protein I6F09_25200 [Bradyrhizobium sp. IC3195]|uniref:hypothetical protein n=1 Tax=Bradyrhizobium sp. IC3195 TaxID=2793804 RepID=UPI001CD5DCFB|nr:hypothetical protein [Bradyrhizobium sp. IC3195]MCA1471165.1 hypothetical protein [Bradyrhizobium sp. IC3195]